MLTILFGLMMVNSGLNKFFNYMAMPEVSAEMTTVLTALMTTEWIFPLVAVVEIAGGILIAIPKYRSLGALIILPVMVGIVVHHLVHDVAGVGMGLVLFAVNLWVIVESREKYLPMVKYAPDQSEGSQHSSAL